MERTCLVVDDNKVIRELIKELLQSERFLALEAENALEAFKLVQTLNGRLDCIVTDIRMPGEMNGVDFALAVRTAFPSIPVILMSAYPYLESGISALDKFKLIEKPFKPAAFLTAVRAVALR